MMNVMRATVVCLLGMSVATAMMAAGGPKFERWTDGQGKVFRGAAAEVIGPFALFRNENYSARRVLLHELSEADCVRFHRALPEDAAEIMPWGQTKGRATGDLAPHLFKLAGEKLEHLNLENIPEPRLLVLIFCMGNGDTDRFEDLMEECVPYYRRYQAQHPGALELVYLSVGRSAAEHVTLARLTSMPWLIADVLKIGEMQSIKRLAPARGQWLWVVNRDGVPLISSVANRTADVTKAFAELDALLTLMQLGAPTWADRLHYFRAVQKAEHVQDRADPMLIGNPVDPKALSQYGIERLHAKIAVAADGTVGRVEISREKSTTAEIAQAIGEALRKGVFVPAVDHGVLVDGTFELTMDIPPAAQEILSPK